MRSEMVIDYASWYDEAYWTAQKRYRAHGEEKVYHGPGLVWDGFDFVADALARVLPKGRLLDIGCGGGDLASRLMLRGFDSYGIDISRHAVENAVPSMKGRIHLHDITQPWPNAISRHYDVVIATDLMEHIYQEDLEYTFQQMMHLGARYYFFLVAVTTGEEFVAKKGEPIPEKWTETAVSGHVHVMRPSWWARFFQTHGLEVDWRRAYLFQSIRERNKPWRDTAGWDHGFTWFCERP